ncbi:hypothetical protein JCM3775_003495 [Rhodotorula graminis]
MVPHRHAPLPELYRLADPAPLLDLVRPNLLDALPLYSTLQTPGLATPLYASFPSFDPDGKPQLVDAAQPDLWLALVDLGNQLRFFCSYEAHDHLTGDQVAQGESLVVGALTRYLSEHRNDRDRAAHTGISIGAIPDTWTSCIARAFSQPFSASRIHYLPLDEVPSTSGGAVLPGGIVCTEGREEDIEEILSTSEVPHPPAYLSTRLAHTSVLRQLLSPPSPSPSPAPSSSSSSPDAAEPPSRILAHCTTHRDGSIGTLHVAPSARQRGLGQLVLLARARAMASPSSSSSTSAAKADEPPPPLRDAPVFCYVHRENEASNALMRRAGMRIARDGAEVWWARVRLPLRNTGFEMDEDGP